MNRVPASLRQALRDLAADTDGIDTAIYATYDRDPLEPIIGLGDADAPLCFFGRDPGREEVRHGEPFIGAGGQIVRRVLYRHLNGAEMPDFEAGRALGRHYFWINTVPYKPIGNKAWSMAVKRRFQPLTDTRFSGNRSGRPAARVRENSAAPRSSRLNSASAARLADASLA